MDPDFEKLKLVGDAFSPGAPVDRRALFAGRTEQVLEVLNAVAQRGQHVILFGERGVGKTSLANVLSELTSVVRPASINCSANDTFSGLWRRVFSEITIGLSSTGPGFVGEERNQPISMVEFLPDDPSPEDIRHAFERIGQEVLVVVDEFDRLNTAPSNGQSPTALMADTIKTLSDHSTAVTVLLVGVADSVDELISEHASVERSLVQVRMPRMSEEELHEIIRKGLDEVEMQIDDPAATEIVTLSQGLPHYTHLLAQHAAQAALLGGKDRVEEEDVEEAIRKAVDKAQQSIVSLYHAATSSPRPESLFDKVLLACAMAPTDQLGFFAAADVREPFSKIMGRQYDIPAYSRHLNDFSDSRGPVLQKIGTPRRFRFRFVNPMMQPFVLMKGRASGLIPDY